MVQNKNLFEVAEVQLVYKSPVKPSERAQITSSKEAYKLLMSIWDTGTIELQEEFKVLLLNARNRVLGVYNVSAGGIGDTAADPKLIFVAALKAKASAIILAHNHPSGDPKASKLDMETTSQIISAGKVIGIQVLDHVIVTRESYCSYADGDF